MNINQQHISYCSNIHPGESWKDHFAELQSKLPEIKQQVAPHQPMGLGLRLSKQAATELQYPQTFRAFKDWLDQHNIYVFTLNGFPYGEFHDTRVKDQVHFPDWASHERLEYTCTLADILADLLPLNLEGGISTSPLSYRFWPETHADQHRKRCTLHILKVAEHLAQIEANTGQYIHLDIEPEPDGSLENFQEFVDWYLDELLPLGKSYFAEKQNLSSQQTIELIKRHIALCYDVCHFALAYDQHEICVERLKKEGINIGKIQISSALKGYLAPEQTAAQSDSLAKLHEFDEPTYLHQVAVRKADNSLIKYRDLPDFFADTIDSDAREWRSHFHVPIFLSDYGETQSTRDDIIEVLRLNRLEPLSKHLEIETYTWNVLPPALQVPIAESITRELVWLKNELTK